MTTPQDIVQELRGLVAELEGELERVEKRIMNAQQARDVVREKLAATRTTIALYRERHHLDEPQPEDISEMREAWAKLATKDLTIEYARRNGGRLVVSDAAHVLARAGLFKDVTNASNNLYSALNRITDMFRKVRPGEYELIDPRPLRDELDQRASPETEPARDEDHESDSDEGGPQPFDFTRNGYRREPVAAMGM